MTSDFPAERWFWFDPPFHRNQSVLLHRQADDVWRVDFQLGWDADPEEEKKPERILPRLRAMLGADARVRDRMGERLHVPVPADAEVPPRPRAVRRRRRAPRVSPFGARGANSGVQDADNLVWKLELVLRGHGAGVAARHLRRRARCGGRREHPQLDARDRLHHAEERGVAHVPRRGARARAAPPVRAAAGQQRTPVGARRCSPIRRSTRRIATCSRARWCRARPRPMRRSRARAAAGCSQHLGGGFTLLVFGDAVAPEAAARHSRRRRCRAAWSRSAARPATARTVIQDKERLVAARYDAQPGTVLPDPPRPARVRALARVRSCRRARARSRARPCNA